jgi:hypothetical protein
VWIFYLFNGPASAKVGLIPSVPLGKIGEHVGDWEHVTLRVSIFSGELLRMYFSHHSVGTWVDASRLGYLDGDNGPTGTGRRRTRPNTGTRSIRTAIRNDFARGSRLDTGAGRCEADTRCRQSSSS